MGDWPPGPYSRRDHRRAVILSAFLGWMAVTGWALSDLRNVQQATGLLPVTAIFGLPVAFLACSLIGGPVLRRMMRQPIKWSRAARGGAGIPAAVAALGATVRLLVRAVIGPGKKAV